MLDDNCMTRRKNVNFNSSVLRIHPGTFLIFAEHFFSVGRPCDRKYKIDKRFSAHTRIFLFFHSRCARQPNNIFPSVIAKIESAATAIDFSAEDHIRAIFLTISAFINSNADMPTKYLSLYVHL